MAQTGQTVIQHYHTTTAGTAPPAGNLAEGELGINVTDKVVYTKNAGGEVVALGQPLGGSTDQVFFENDTNVTADYTIRTGKNAMSAGPITIDSGKTVTIPSGSVWSIV